MYGTLASPPDCFQARPYEDWLKINSDVDGRDTFEIYSYACMTVYRQLHRWCRLVSEVRLECAVERRLRGVHLPEDD